MIQTTAILDQLTEGELERPALWGLTAPELHDAYWNAHGVQCVRRGRHEKLQRGADLFLLIEPDQLVLFDVRSMAERLAWRAAAVTRLRIVDQSDESYGELVEVDENDRVVRIARRYRADTHAAYRVLLTRRRRLARLWMSAEVRRAGWRKIRRLAGDSHIDTRRHPGECFTNGEPADERRMIDRLVELWRRPDHAIQGIEQAGDGVWIVRGATVAQNATAIGPAWLGHVHDMSGACIVGPTWIGDDCSAPRDYLSGVRVRPIWQIDPSSEPSEPANARRTGLWYALTKRSMDVLLAASGLVIASPLMLLIAICIVIEDGRPLFFGQQRQTRGGRTFRCWKFRTMCRGADRLKQELSKQNVCDGPQFFVANDPRATRIGRMLRRCHFDELPQLWNVLVGQMSLVGPRPSPEQENQICPAWREMRLSVRPGLTGLWQLKRTRQPGTDFQEWIRYDLEYLDSASVWLDIRILWATFWAVVTRRQ